MELKDLISKAVAQYDTNSENKEFKVIINVPYQTTISIFSSIVGCFEHEETCFSSNLDKSFLFVPEKYYDFNIDITPLSDNSGTQLVFQYN